MGRFPDPPQSKGSCPLSGARKTPSLCPASFHTSSSVIPPDREPLGRSSKEETRGTRGSTTEHKAAEGLGSAAGTDKEKDLPLLGLAPGSSC